MKGYVESSNAKYQKWIDKNIGKNPIGQCTAKAKDMCRVFKELSVKGYFDIFGQGHAWCVEPNGKIVDPTAHQFSSPYRYPSDPFDPEDFPQGKCMWCGEIILPDTPRIRNYFECMDMCIGSHITCNECLAEEYK